MRNTALYEAQAGIKIVRRNIKNLRYADDNTLMAEKRRTKEPLDESEGEEWKADLKLNVHKTNVRATDPITSWQIDGETVETLAYLFWGAPKSLQMVTVAMKLKDAWSWEEKLWLT